MLSINCILADISNRYRIAEEYGTCNDKNESLLRCATSYYWLYNNAWDCLTEEQKCDLDVFIKSNFNCKYYTPCTQSTTDCSNLNSVTITSDFSNADEYKYTYTASNLIGQPPYTYLWTFDNSDYHLDTGSTATSASITLVRDELASVPASQVTLQVRDNQDCVAVKTYNYTCVPGVNNTDFGTLCLATFSISILGMLNTSICPYTNLNWAITEFQLPTGFSVIMNGAVAEFSTSGVSAGTKVIPVRVRTMNGDYSNWANITVNLQPIC